MTDKMRETKQVIYNILWDMRIAPRHQIEQAALVIANTVCASEDADIINLHEVNRSLRDSNADMLRHFKSNEQQLAAADDKIKVALEALKSAEELVVDSKSLGMLIPCNLFDKCFEHLELLEQEEGK